MTSNVSLFNFACGLQIFLLSSALEALFGVLGFGNTKGHEKLILAALSLIWVD